MNTNPTNSANYERTRFSLFVTFVLLTNTVGVKPFTVFGQTLPVSILWYRQMIASFFN